MRTVKDLINDLKKYDENLPIIYSIDDEGNSFNYVSFGACKGKFDGYSFIDENSDAGNVVVCIN